MTEVARTKVESIENLIQQFEQAQQEAVVQYDGLIKAARQLQQQSNLYEKVIENSRDAVFVVENDSGVIRHVNDAACQLLGYTSEELLGRRQITLFPEELHLELKAEFRMIRHRGWISSLRSRLQKADGGLVDVSISANALPDSYQGLTVGFARDVSEQVRAEEELRALNEELENRVEQRTREIHRSNEELELAIREANRHAAEAEAANEAKSQFLANMTHEVRTPLNAVVGMLDLLMDMGLGVKERETAQVISRSAKVLSGLINDILDFSKIEAGRLELDKVVFVLPELTRQLLETFSFQARDKGLDLDLEMDPDLPEFVIGDPGRLRQVLVNLLGNALKFTEKGRVTLKVTRETGSSRRHAVTFAVDDTGIGIAPDRLQDIFQPFVQADATVTRRFGGTGLGLNIAANLVTRMGGALEVQSVPGSGSSFFFTAYFDKATTEQIDAARNSSAPAVAAPEPTPVAPDQPARDLRILLVEDNKLNQRVATGMLAKLGCKADTAETGPDALKQLGVKQFDLVFMDLQMPEMGGLEVTRRLRQGEAGEANRHVPVVAMTARASREDRKSCLAAGMNDYVPKPISTELISRAMDRVLRPGDPAEPEVLPDFTLDALIAQSEGDAGLAAEVFDQFMTDARRHLNLIIGALQNYDFGFATQEARSLESRALNLRAGSVVQAVRELTQAAGQKQQERALELAEDVRRALGELGALV
jgi:PAS domain S-box-containing protein